MKIIDLLNKIANGDKLPNKIKLECVNSINEHNCIYEFNPIAETYINEDGMSIQNATCFATLLNLEVEIIEEDKKIDPLGTWFGLEKDCENDNIQYANTNFKLIYEKINEIIDYINKEEK